MTQPTPKSRPREPLSETFSRTRMLRFRASQAFAWWMQVSLRWPLSRALVGMGMLLRRIGVRKKGLSLLLSGRRVAGVPSADTAIRTILSEDSHAEHDLVSMFGESASRPLTSCASRILILKVPKLEKGELREKGALIIKFTETFAPMFIGLDVQRLVKYFRIILEPSWVGYSLPEVLVWALTGPEKIIVMAPYQPDYNLLEAIESNLVPITLGPADWANPTRFHKLEGVEKIFDAIYVANYSPKKRVDRYLRAIVRVSHRRPGFRAALICAGVGWDEHGREIRETIAWAKSKADLTFFDGVKQPQLNELFNQSKVNVLLSLREGMNKGLAEGLFSGTPALLLEESACGNHRHVNPETGRVVRDRNLETTLEWFAEHHGEFRTHEWARSRISAPISTLSLSRILQDIEASEGRPWTTNLLPKANQPEMRYFHSCDEWLLEKRVPLLEAFEKGRAGMYAHAFLESLELELEFRSRLKAGRCEPWGTEWNSS